MNRIAQILVTAIVLVLVTSGASAQHNERQPAETVAPSAHAPTSPRPVLPDEPSNWAGPMLIIVAAMFVSAALVGPIVRSELPDVLPDASTHDHAAHDHKSSGHGHH